MPTPNPLIAELTRRGIAGAKAVELLAAVEPGQDVAAQLAYVDTLVAKDTRGRLDNPPGLYIKYVQQNIQAPEGFAGLRKATAAQQAALEQRLAAKREAARLKDDHEAFCEEQISRFIKDVLPQHDYDQLYQANLRKNRQMLAEMPEDEMQRLTCGTVRSELRHGGRIDLPTLEQFTRSLVDQHHTVSA